MVVSDACIFSAKCFVIIMCSPSPSSSYSDIRVSYTYVRLRNLIYITSVGISTLDIFRYMICSVGIVI